jgi:hypothetical protein
MFDNGPIQAIRVRGHRRVKGPPLPTITGIWDVRNAILFESSIDEIPSSGTVNKPFVRRGSGNRPTLVSTGWARFPSESHLHFLNAEDVIGSSGYLAVVANNITAPTLGNQILIGGLGDNPANNAFNAGFLNQQQSNGGNIIAQIRDSGGAKQVSSGQPTGLHFFEMRWNGTISQIRRNWGSWSQVSAGSPTNLNQDMLIGHFATTTDAVFDAALFFAHNEYPNGESVETVLIQVENYVKHRFPGLT